LLGFDVENRIIEIYKSVDDQRFCQGDQQTVAISLKNNISCSRFRIQADSPCFFGRVDFAMRAIEFYGDLRPN
jgi:hypothetical protein